ncbi:MAG: DUF4925 domain-containing protein [Duncaniella sp.]|nr:DUF4925 domain-containing protein [Duncaniella sp.]
MKKSFFYFIVIAGTLMSASCSDDKQPWENIPSSPITGNDAVVTFNGDRSYGVVTVDTRSESSALVTLSNIIPGYPEITVPADMKQSGDGTFSLSGSTSLATPPEIFPMSKATASSSIYEMALKGTVTDSGKAQIAVTSTLTADAQGKFTGKWIPEKMLPITAELIAHAPVVVDLAIKGQPEKSAELSATLSLLGGLALYNSIGALDLQENGSMVIDYSTAIDLARALREGIDQNNGIYKAITDFKGSTGRNLVFWYNRADYLFVTPYIPNISYKIDVDNGNNPNLNDGAVTEKLEKMLADLAAMGIDTKALMSTFTSLNSTGIPIAAMPDGSSLKLVIDKKMIDPFISLLAPALPALDLKLKEYLADPANSAVAEILTTQLFPALGISSLQDLGKLWEEGIETFTITINLVKA